MRRLWITLTAALVLLAGSAVVPATVAVAANTYPTNPLGFAYAETDNVAAWYGRPSGMVIAGRCNKDGQEGLEYANARKNGAEVLAYLAVPERPDSQVCPEDTQFYGGDLSRTPLWPFAERVNWPGTHLTDITVGSPWIDHVVSYIENLMRTDAFDGVFLDVVGARLWRADTADWESWPLAEQQAWTAGNVDLVRRLDASRRAINPRFIIVNNNVWDVPGTAGVNGERYVDGICLEHHGPNGPYHQRVAGKEYSNLGHRRVLAIARSTAEAQQWATVQGVTHVSDQTVYRQVSPPPIPFNRLTDRPRTLGRTTIAANPTGGLTANQKRGSKFTLPTRATLLRFAAYLDGLGGPTTGSQTVRMALYRDNNGIPAGRWAQSNVITINAGTPGRWVTFTAPATTLDPGQYWIVLHTGDTEGVIRTRGDGPANWYASIDQFADGPSNPFGTGWTGNITLSVKADYTVGY